MAKVLIIDDESQIRRILAVMLLERGFEVSEAESGEQGLRSAVESRPDVALIDISMPGMDGLATLKALLEHTGSTGTRIDCIMMTAYGTIRSAVEAMRLGAFDYITKPFDNEELLLIVDRALEMSRLTDEVNDLRAELSTRYGFSEIVGISPGLQAVFRTMVKVAPVDASVLIEGESGTGKELVARAIHRKSPRSSGPFVAVNCGAIPQSLFEAQFFGHERGAFTDAHQARAGLFEQSQGGSLFLDEIGELHLEGQVKLLRALQNREVTRLGSRNPISVNVRVIAATNIGLRQAVDKGKFREDLYWRLNVVKIRVPSLRERREDIPLLIDHMVARFNMELGLSVNSIAPDARKLLELHDWPGNVRELENVICSSMILCDGAQVKASDLPPRLRGGTEPESARSAGETDFAKATLSEALKDASERIERRMILTRLAEMGGSRTATADSLGISRKTLFNKMRQFGLADQFGAEKDGKDG